MSKLIFGKYEGAGNDFILIDDRSHTFDRTLVRRLCHRKFGIGADGVVLLQLDPSADFRMRIFNSDGTEPSGCGNGLRCLIRFLEHLGFPRKTYRIAIGEKSVDAGFDGERIFTELGPPSLIKLRQRIGPWEVHSLDTGVPHAVVFVPDVRTVDLMREAPILRHHPAFHPDGTNVNFASIDGGAIRVRTFERGVEGETLACGTGAAAVAYAAIAVHCCESPVQVIFPGGNIEIHSGSGALRMIGKAQLVFRGEFPLF